MSDTTGSFPISGLPTQEAPTNWYFQPFSGVTFSGGGTGDPIIVEAYVSRYQYGSADASTVEAGLLVGKDIVRPFTGPPGTWFDVVAPTLAQAQSDLDAATLVLDPTTESGTYNLSVSLVDAVTGTVLTSSNASTVNYIQRGMYPPASSNPLGIGSSGSPGAGTLFSNVMLSDTAGSEAPAFLYIAMMQASDGPSTPVPLTLTGAGLTPVASGLWEIQGTLAEAQQDLNNLHYTLNAESPTTFQYGLILSDSLSSNTESTGYLSLAPTADPVCYVRGTRIATPAGEVAIEHLKPGDLVLTASGQSRPVIWIGHRRVDCRRHPDPRKVYPIRISANAFGQGLPARDLRVSPQHGIHAEGVLIPAKVLANGATIRQERVAAIEYFHIELERHDILLAEGLPSESYLDTGDRASFENGGGALILYPDFARWAWDARACAELRMVGPEVDRARASLAANAANLTRPAGKRLTL